MAGTQRCPGREGNCLNDLLTIEFSILWSPETSDKTLDGIAPFLFLAPIFLKKDIFRPKNDDPRSGWVIFVVTNLIVIVSQ